MQIDSLKNPESHPFGYNVYIQSNIAVLCIILEEYRNKICYHFEYSK